jgi:hypothetical protein
LGYIMFYFFVFFFFCVILHLEFVVGNFMSFFWLLARLQAKSCSSKMLQPYGVLCYNKQTMALQSHIPSWAWAICETIVKLSNPIVTSCVIYQMGALASWGCTIIHHFYILWTLPRPCIYDCS